MSSEQCDAPNCTVYIAHKCDRCGNSFCIRHIDFNNRRHAYLCTQCYQILTNREKSQSNLALKLGIVGILMVVIGIAAGISMNPNVTLGVCTGIVGVILIIAAQLTLQYSYSAIRDPD